MLVFLKESFNSYISWLHSSYKNIIYFSNVMIYLLTLWLLVFILRLFSLSLCYKVFLQSLTCTSKSNIQRHLWYSFTPHNAYLWVSSDLLRMVTNISITSCYGYSKNVKMYYNQDKISKLFWLISHRGYYYYGLHIILVEQSRIGSMCVGCSII